MKLCVAAVLLLQLVIPPAASANTPECRIRAQEMKLKGKPLDSYLRNCASVAKSDPTIVCDQAARDRRLAGATRNMHVKQCLARAGRSG